MSIYSLAELLKGKIDDVPSVGRVCRGEEEDSIFECIHEIYLSRETKGAPCGCIMAGVIGEETSKVALDFRACSPAHLDLAKKELQDIPYSDIRYELANKTEANSD